MTIDVLLKHQEMQTIWYLVIREDGSLWTEPGLKVGGPHKVFDNLAQATSQGWRVKNLTLPKEDLANENL